MKFPARPSSSPGVALVITLFFLILVSILVVGFISTAKFDRVAANSHFERMRAQSMASEGVETVMATLQRETADQPYNTYVSNYVPRNWISQPGAISITDYTSSTPTKLVKQVPLSSGAPSAAYLTGTGIDSVLWPPDLNTQLLVDQSPPTHLLSEQIDPNTNATVKMKVRWIYVRQDGTYDLDNTGLPTEGPVATNTSNPIIGRFAYWTDDECAKVNYNLAWTRNPTLNLAGPSNQTKVDLRAMSGFTDTIANNLHNAITTNSYLNVNRFYNSPFDARLQADTTTRAALDLNKFNLTHYNSDPDITYYGLPRMMLTTQLANAVVRDAEGNIVMNNNQPVVRPFLDILKNPRYSIGYIDPGSTVINGDANKGNVDATKLNTLVNNLVNNYLKRTDWPMVDGTGHSIQEKYYTTYTGAARDQRLAQLALNIIDYVRSAESQLTVVQPIRAKWINGVFTPDFSNSTIEGTDDTFKGLTRAPHITELGMYVSDTAETSGPNKGRYRSVALTEVYLPRNYGIDQLDLLNTDGKQWNLYVGEMSTTYKDANNSNVAMYYKADGTVATNEYQVVAPKNPTTSPAFIWDAQSESSTQISQSNSKSKMHPGDYRTFAMEVWRAKSKKDVPTVSLRSAITVAGGPRIDVTPLATPLTYTLDSNVSSEMAVSSFENADPCVNGVTKDWTLARTNTFGADNNARTQSLAAPMKINNKALTVVQDLDASGKISTEGMRMPYPYVATNSQTGRVRSSGELGLIHTGIEGSNSAPQPGIPWRTLHLQPSNLPSTIVPDWAFMDLFTVPADVPVAGASLFAPHSNSTGGRINVNANPVPFNLQRTDPLTAALYGAQRSSLTTTTLSLSEAQTIAHNIYNHTLATGGNSLPAGKLYPASSSLPNVYESPGEIAEIAGVADQGEESEQLVRDIANLITSRGNVFTVYTVGQALKQTPNGKLVVTGEQRQEAMIERYLLTKSTPTLTDDSVGFRTVYFRNLTP